MKERKKHGAKVPTPKKKQHPPQFVSKLTRGFRSQLNPINSNKTGKSKSKEKEYEQYIIWKSLPRTLAGLRDDDLDALGLKNEEAFKLCTIKTQEEFARKIGVCADTLSDWNKREDLRLRIAQARAAWQGKLTSDVIMAIYMGALRKGGSADRRMWLKEVAPVAEKKEEGSAIILVTSKSKEERTFPPVPNGEK